MSCQFWTLLYGPKAQWGAMAEFSKSQIDRIFHKSVVRPLYEYLSFDILNISVLIHEGSSPPLSNILKGLGGFVDKITQIKISL